ncbi:hypothetical protein KUV85_09935 [Nocardioides panacisoli]|uniref:hypothetical protein n=1 Tax=Nocardioides panacisoli TaxID=627624 RepID=UPI001C634EC1|nr:hypothetical protein [Nocardioides panacisoli]QYJ02660.1 hypothetical protein KUV85_09935 [Nocardioides panacisoli]
MSEQPPQNPYQPPAGPGGPWGPPPSEHPQATLILVLGVLGITLCQLLGPVALVMGGRARKEIEAAQGTIGGSTQVTVGWALGIAGTIILAITVLVFAAAIVIVGVAGFGTMAATGR